MKMSPLTLAAVPLLVLWASRICGFAAPVVTSRNSTVSVPTAQIATNTFPWSTNLVGSNFMVSSVAPSTPNGGRATLVSSLQWLGQYHAGFDDGAYTMMLRTDGSVVAAGYIRDFATSSDFALVCYSRDGTALWTNRYDGPAHGADYGRYIGTTPAGEVWMVGESSRQPDFIPSDIVLIKYASNGAPLWTNRFASFETNSSYPGGLRVDASGNAYVLEHTTAWMGGSGIPVGEALTKFDSSGNGVWTKRYPANGPDSGLGIFDPSLLTMTAEGQLIVAGSSGRPHYTTGTSIMRFSEDGTALWTNYQPFANSFMPRTIRMDQPGNIIIAGDSTRNGTSYEIRKLSSAGASLWSNQLPGPIYSGGSVPEALPDRQGNIFAIGGSPGKSTGFYDIVKFNSQGLALWTNQNVHFGSTNGQFRTASLDNAGNLWLQGNVRTDGQTDYEIVVLKFSNDGSPLWTNRFNGTAGLNDIGHAMVLDTQGSVYVSGQSYPAPGLSDFVTLKFADNLIYVPPQNFTGTDTLTCTLTDHLGHSATGAVSVLVLPTSFTFNLSQPFNWMTATGLHLNLSGFPGTNGVVLEASSNFISWERIFTNTPNAGAVEFLDPAATTQARRFYRAFQAP